MIEDFQARILPRNKEFLKSILNKPAEDRTVSEIAYQDFMRENFKEITRSAELERWNEHKANNSSD